MKRLFVIVLAGFFSLAFTSRASADLIVNGGFETGDFTGWDTSNIFGQNSNVYGFNPHSGLKAAYFDALSSQPDVLEQSVVASVGTSYTLSFWLSCFEDRLGGPDNSWKVFWNGVEIGGEVDRLNDFDVYANFTMSITAIQVNNLLTFEFSNEVGGFDLDDVSLVVEVPVPAGVILFGVGAAGLALMNLRRRYLTKPV